MTPALSETTHLIQPSVSPNKSPSRREADSSSLRSQPKDKASALTRLEDTGKLVTFAKSKLWFTHWP